jgi:hypothetical protein
MHLADLDHGSQNVVPGLLLHHHFIGEHTTIPAYMLESFRQLSILIAKPVASVCGNI